MSERGIPFHCPYCGEQDLWPHEVPVDGGDSAAGGETTSPPGSWECRGCQRAFSLKMLGLIRPQGAAGGGYR